MEITCPKCSFSRTVDASRVPDRPVRVTCPKCGEEFRFERRAPESATYAQLLTGAARTAARPTGAQKPAAPAQAAVVDTGRRIICSACGTVQPPSGRCSRCGATIVATAAPAVAVSYAGFWTRTTAYTLDSVLLITVQFVLGLLIDLAIGALGFSIDGDPLMETILWLFGATISLAYAVFFTGYCGQTPGKMALRLKVVRCDGAPVGYGRAFLREVPGKFISAILLGVGFLMVAFDDRKRGLHDKIADTCVIKI